MTSAAIRSAGRTLLWHCGKALRPREQHQSLSSPWISRLIQRSFASYPPHAVVGLPALSPTMDSGSIASWNLGVGDSFAAGDIICSIETDKATVDFESQDDGFVAKILAEAGSGEIKVGDPIMVTVESEDDVGAFADFKVDASAATSPPAKEASPSSSAPPAAAASTPSTTTTAQPTRATASSGERVFATPLARMLAKELGFSIEQIPGTGPGGRVLAADVKEFTPSAAAAAAESATPAPATKSIQTAAPVPGEGYTDYPLSVHAQEVAARLQQAKRNIPHYYLTVDINMDNLLATRASLNKTLPEETQLGVYEFLLKAASAAMKSIPNANAAWMDSHVRVYDHINVNVVVGSGDSLYTPVIANLGAKGLKEISSELHSFMAALEPAGQGQEPPSVLGGLGTFTVMNLGMYGIKSCAPIIREPQSCALAIGALEYRIIPNDDDGAESIYKEAVMMTATMSFDHRVVDGAVGAQWLAAFKTHVENPNSLLL
ncbi:hypothetical protein ACA910_011282 [Epithemia clementina (nom. ined.)]